MSRRLSLAYLTVNGVSLPEHVAVAAETGYQSVGLRLLGSRPPKTDDWPNDALIRQTEQRLHDTGVTVLDTEIFWLLPETNVAESSGLFEVIQRLGSHLLLVLGRDPDQQRAFDNFAALCDLAARYDVKPCLEFSKITSVATLGDAVDIVRRTGAPNARVLVDALHLSRSGPLVELVRALPADLPLAVEAPVKQMEFLPASERAWMAMEGLLSILERT